MSWWDGWSETLPPDQAEEKRQTFLNIRKEKGWGERMREGPKLMCFFHVVSAGWSWLVHGWWTLKHLSWYYPHRSDAHMYSASCLQDFPFTKGQGCLMVQFIPNHKLNGRNILHSLQQNSSCKKVKMVNMITCFRMAQSLWTRLHAWMSVLLHRSSHPVWYPVRPFKLS